VVDKVSLLQSETLWFGDVFQLVTLTNINGQFANLKTNLKEEGLSVQLVTILSSSQSPLCMSSVVSTEAAT
jgi:hypothetical protein